MSNQNFSNGAFCFITARGLLPADPEAIKAKARELGLEDSLVPEYAGDRTTVSRVISKVAPLASRVHHYLLRPISAPKCRTEAVYGIVHESKNAAAKSLAHHFEATVEWKEGDDSMKGDHPIARLCDVEYRALKGKIVSDDWTGTVTSYISGACYGTAMRDDGRVYWIPPQMVAKVETLKSLLAAVGIYVVLCEINSGDSMGIPQAAVKQAAELSLSEQLEALRAEADAFDGKQNEKTYADRLEQYADMKRRATFYAEALGLAVDDAKAILTTLERKVDVLLDVRSRTTIKRPRKNKSEGGDLAVDGNNMSRDMWGDDGDEPGMGDEGSPAGR